MFLILRFNGAPTTNSSISYNYCPHLRYKFRFVNPRAIVFLMACPWYHTVLWVDESEYLPAEGIQVLLFLTTVVTPILYETTHLLGENQYHKSRRLSFSTSPTTKNITSLTISFTYLSKKWGRDCQVNTIRLFSFHLLFWHCSYHCTLGFLMFSSGVSWTGEMTIADFCRRITQFSSLYVKNGISGG